MDLSATRVKIGLTAMPGIVICLCGFVAGCSDGPDASARWEHSLIGLYEAALSNDGRFAVVSSIGGNTGYWDLRANTKIYSWRHNDSDDADILHIAIAPNNSHVITADARSFVVWDVSTGRADGYWSVDANIVDVAIANDGRFVLIGLTDGRAIHINQQSRRRLEVVAHRHERVTSVDLTADGVIAATGGNDGRVMVWNSITGAEIHAFEHASRIAIIKIDPSGQRILTADDQGNAFIWDLASGNKLATLNLENHQHVISAASFSHDGSQLLLGFPGTDVRLWDSSSGQLIGSWRTSNRIKGWVPQGSTVYAVAINEQENTVMAESSNGLGLAWPNVSGY